MLDQVMRQMIFTRVITKTVREVWEKKWAEVAQELELQVP